MPRDILIHLTVETPVSTEVLVSHVTCIRSQRIAAYLLQGREQQSGESGGDVLALTLASTELDFVVALYIVWELRYLQEWSGCEREKE